MLYVAVRPMLDTLVPHLVIAEFPVALLGAALVVRMVVRARRRRRREAQAAEGAPVELPLGTRHAQVVRDVPDPEAARVRDVLDAWLATGEGRDEVVRTLARDAAGRPDDTLARRIDDALANAGARRAQRERALSDVLAQLGPAPDPSSPRTPRKTSRPSKPSGA